MKNRLFNDIRGWFNARRDGQYRGQNGFADIYVTDLVKKLNYCKQHPDSSCCQ